MPILTDMYAQFRAQIQPNATKEDYQRLINATFVMEKGYWDLIVAKLDSLLNYITNGSWSLSEKTVLINKIDYFRGTLLMKLDGFFTNGLNYYRGDFTCTIDREIFCFVMKNISTKPLSSDVTLNLKLNQGGLPAIQLNSASRLLAEYPDNITITGGLQFQDYDPNKAKHIPQELSQLLCALMSLCEQSCLWNELYNEIYGNLTYNAGTVAANSLANLNNKCNHFNSRITAALSELREYISLTGFDHRNPINFDLFTNKVATFSEKTRLWTSIQNWIKAADPNELTNMLSIKSNIYAFLDCDVL